jgi:hypothetical protein
MLISGPSKDFVRSTIRQIMEQNLKHFLDSLIETSRRDSVFSYILYRLSPSYIISSNLVSKAFTDLLSRASKDELSKILPIPAALTPRENLNSHINAKSTPISVNNQPAISQRLLGIVCQLPARVGDDVPSDDGDFELYAAKYWGDCKTSASVNRNEPDPTQRFVHLNEEESRVSFSIEILDCRDRLVKVLKGNEREFVSVRIKAQQGNLSTHQIQSQTNKWLAKQLGMTLQDAKNCSTMWRRFVAFIVDFGPGIIRYLRGSTSR